MSEELEVLKMLQLNEIMNDPNSQTTQKLISLMQAKTGSERLELGASMYDFSKQLVTSSILKESPNLTPSALRQALFLRFYESDFDSIQKQKIMEYFGRTTVE